LFSVWSVPTNTIPRPFIITGAGLHSTFTVLIVVPRFVVMLVVAGLNSSPVRSSDKLLLTHNKSRVPGPAPIGDVLVFGEDPVDTVHAPRLIAAGADLRRVSKWSGSFLLEGRRGRFGLTVTGVMSE